MVTRRLCTARDINGFVKDAAAALGFPRSHFSSTSLRKWGPTEGASAGGSGGYDQAMGGWKSGAVMTAHYNKVGLSYRSIEDRGGKALTVDQVRGMLSITRRDVGPGATGAGARGDAGAAMDVEEEYDPAVDAFLLRIFGEDSSG